MIKDYFKIYKKEKENKLEEKNIFILNTFIEINLNQNNYKPEEQKKPSLKRK